MKFTLESKLFILALFFSIAWIAGMFFSQIKTEYLDAIRTILTLIVGAFIGAYKKGE